MFNHCDILTEDAIYIAVIAIWRRGQDMFHLQCDTVDTGKGSNSDVTFPVFTLSRIYLTSFYLWNYSAQWNGESRTRLFLHSCRDCAMEAREALALASSWTHGRNDCVVLCCVVWAESRIISETSSEQSTGRSASLLGPTVCDHPARINPSSVLGVTTERFTRLYIFILLFAFDHRSAHRIE